jgi:signal transduction histidine kinase/CheY-like chemotaxis protein
MSCVSRGAPRRSGRWLRAIACLFLAGSALADESGRPLLQRFSAKEYQTHYQVWSAAQAPDGLLWFGSAGGVLHYDGRTWGSVSVPTSFVRQVAIATDGTVYLAGEDEFGFVRRAADGSLTYHTLADRVAAAAKPFGLPRRVAIAGDAVYFATDRAVFRWQDGKLHTWTFPSERRNVIDVIGDEVFLLRGAEGIRRLRGTEFEPWAQPAEMNKSQFTFLMPPPPGTGATALLALGRDGLFLLDAQGRSSPWTHAAAETLRGTQLFSGRRLTDGTYALGTIGAGVILLAADGRSFTQHTTADGLTHDSVIGLGEDREGGLWLATQNGLTRLDRSVRATIFDTANGLGDGFLLGLVRHHDGHLYAAFSQRLLRLEPGTKPGAAKWIRDPRVPTDLAVTQVASHRAGLMVATNKGLFTLHGDRLDPVAGQVNQPTSLLVSESDPRRLFIGYDLTVASVRHEDGRWIDEGRIPRVEGEPFTLVESDGALWIATSTRGVYRVEPDAQGNWQKGTVHPFFESHGLPPGHGWIFVRRSSLGVHFSTEKGLYRFDPKDGRFLADDRIVVDGRQRLCIEAIAPGGPDEIWFAASPSRLAVTYPLVRARREADGSIRSEELPSAIRSLLGISGAQYILTESGASGDVVWVKGMDNLLRLEAAQSAAPRVAWTPILHRFDVDGRSQSFRDAGPLRFDYNRGSYVFRYAGPLVRAGAAPVFQTRLLGFRDDWSEFTREPEATFTNLEGGPFTFEVRGRDADGNLSDVARVTFSVTPPWHRRPLAFVGYALILGLGLAAYVRWRLHAVRRERDHLERLVAERTGELIEAKQRADAASAAKSTFLAHMSHELRTPLNGIIGYAQILRRSDALPPEDRARVEIVNSSGEHLLRMINEVLDFAKIEAGKLELRPAPFPLAQCLQEIAANLAPRAHEKQLGFDVELRGLGAELVLGDAQKLRQVLENLLGNAIKFTTAGRVALLVEGADERVTFTVSDTGVGIAAGDLERLFEPFHQARENRPNAPGTGLGLAISCRLVALLGGELQVDSTPGRGSRFWFTLPLPRLDSRPDETVSGRIVGYAGPRRRLLVVDDVAVNRQLLVDLLSPLGFHVEQAANGQDGLAAARALRPDLVFLDLRLPDLHGLEVARLLRADPRTQHAALLAMSASVLSFNRDEAFAAGCDGFLPKPFREDDLLKALGAALGLAWVQAEAAAPAAIAGPRPSPTLASELLALADTGDIAALRAAVAAARRTHPNDVTLRQIESAVASYQLELVRSLLRSTPSG